MQENAGAQKSTLRRIFSGTLGSILLAIAVLEGGSLIALSIIEGHVCAYRCLHRHRAEAQLVNTAKPLERVLKSWEVPGYPEAIHPYLGFTFDPKLRGETNQGEVTAFGFWPQAGNFPRAPDQSTVIVGIFGGSFALNLAHDASDVLSEAIAPMFPGRKIRVMNFAFGGFKQPQQLITLAYLLMLGVHLDVVVSIDGFNEVAMPIAENAPAGTFPYYPRAWAIRTADVKNLSELSTVGEIAFFSTVRRTCSALAEKVPFSLSLTAGFVWRVFDTVLERTLAQKRLALLTQKGFSSFHQRGPSVNVSDPVLLSKELVSAWMESIRSMHALTESRDILSLFVLQPNQYDAGSKPMGAAERAVAYDPEHPYKEGAEIGYPHLKEGAASLQKEGFPVVDFTQIFAKNSDPLYVDACCHVGRTGSSIVARAVGEALFKQYRLVPP